jgi:hypothetical protein
MTAILPFCSLCIWMYLMVAHGRFFSSRPQLPPALPAAFPEVDIIVYQSRRAGQASYGR